MNLETKQNNEGGFTLVELAIVMIIIGLLIGGILKGQELIANSQTTATIAQIKGIDAATSTFRDKYSALPGDMDPDNRLPNCDDAPCSQDGNADGRIDGANGTAGGADPTLTTESVVAFSHLAAADLLSGIKSSGGELSFGSALPEAKVDGGFTGIEWATDGALGGGAATARSGHFLVLNGLPDSNINDDTATLLPARAAQIDRKLDDGLPNSGSVRGAASNDCAEGTDSEDVYNEGSDEGGCAMLLRVQG